MMNDKVQHFIVGFVLSATGMIWFPLIMTGFAFGIGKELYDWYTGKGVVELNDVLATFLGAILATIIVVLI